MKINKYVFVFYIAIFVSTIIMTFSITYSYLKKDKKTTESVIYKNVSLLTTFDNDNKISLNRLSKGLEKKYTFSINNSSIDSVVDYKISFRIITPFSSVIDKNFIYSIEGKSENTDKNNILINKSDGIVPVNSSDIGNGTITPKTTHNYVLTIKYKDTKEKIDFNNKVFVSEILVENVIRGN